MAYVLKLFKNVSEGRPRAFWRLLVQFVLSLIIPVPFVILAVVTFAWSQGVSLEEGIFFGPGPEVESMVLSSPVILTVLQFISTLGIVTSVWLAARFLDHRSFTSLGLRLHRDWWIDLGFGLALGALLMVSIFLVEWAAGWVTIVGTLQTDEPGQPFFLAILLPIVLYLGVGVSEELLSRGYQLRNMAEGLNFAAIGPRGAILLALLLSSSIFGVLHLGNPNTTAISTINIAVAGLFFGAAYVLAGQLAIPIGLHIAWNFFQGNVFGFPVSGVEWSQTTFIDIDQRGPELWTGGAFGPEAGLLDPIASFVGILLILLWVRRRYGRVFLETSLAQPPTQRILTKAEKEQEYHGRNSPDR